MSSISNDFAYTKEQLAADMRKLGFAPRDMCTFFGLERTTFQNYLYGHRKIPLELQKAILEEIPRSKEFLMKTVPQIVEREMNKIGGYIQSEKEDEDD